MLTDKFGFFWLTRVSETDNVIEPSRGWDCIMCAVGPPLESVLLGCPKILPKATARVAGTAWPVALAGKQYVIDESAGSLEPAVNSRGMG